MTQRMHDWTLRAVTVDCGAGVARLDFDAPGGRALLQAHGLHDLHIPRAESWGPSVSVSEARGPLEIDGGLLRFSIEMQSGDIVVIVARSFDIPMS